MYRNLSTGTLQVKFCHPLRKVLSPLNQLRHFPNGNRLPLVSKCETTQLRVVFKSVERREREMREIRKIKKERRRERTVRYKPVRQIPARR